MGKKFYNEIIKPYVVIDRMVMIILALAVLSFSTLWGIIAIVMVATSFIYAEILTNGNTDKKAAAFEENYIREKDAMFKGFTESNPMLLCLIDREGTVHWKNRGFSEVFADEERAHDVLSKNFLKPFFEEEGYSRTLSLDGSLYFISTAALEGDAGKLILFFDDVTENSELKKKYEDSRTCLAYITIDNYDELVESAPTEVQASITASIDKLLQGWCTGLSGALIRLRSGRYVMVFEQQFLDGLKVTRFPILDRMHEIENEADFPTTISIGLAVGSPDMATLQDDALEALDLALGRGGDQAVVKASGADPEFYGGALTTVEKRKKGKSRIVAHALAQLVTSSDRVIIMGHKRPDLDCYGGAIGLYTFVRAQGRQADIVIDGEYEGVEIIHKAALENGGFSYLTHEEAAAQITKDSLLIVEDTHIPFITECPELLEKTNRIVVIDHHRKSKDAIEDPTLSYAETYASSASELVTELLQYSTEKPNISKFVADALLAGITVDTKNFTVNAGVRTFEAAAWLRRCGADNATVQSFFKMRLEAYKKKVNIIASAELLPNGCAVAYTKESDPGMQLLVAQAADELLGMKGVEAAFAAGAGTSATMISARSMGKINVQTIMEAMGGGGHLTGAAAQVPEPPEEAIARIVNYMRENGML